MGVPPPLLEWLNNDLPLSNINDSVTILTTNNTSNGTFTLQWINVRTDADGIFNCITTNYLGSENISFDVQILSEFLLSIKALHILFEGLVHD